MKLKIFGLMFAAGVAALVAIPPVQAAPAIGTGLDRAAPDNPLLQDVQGRAFVFRGRTFCFYFDGWNGPGWYRCGWNWRRGLGWGGVYGWNNWEWGPAARRFGHGGGRWSGRSASGRGGNWGSRSGAAVQSPSGSTRSTIGSGTAGPRRSGTTGASPGAGAGAGGSVGGGAGLGGGGGGAGPGGGISGGAGAGAGGGAGASGGGGAGASGGGGGGDSGRR